MWGGKRQAVNRALKMLFSVERKERNQGDLPAGTMEAGTGGAMGATGKENRGTPSPQGEALGVHKRGVI